MSATSKGRPDNSKKKENPNTQTYISGIFFFATNQTQNYKGMYESIYVSYGASNM